MEQLRLIRQHRWPHYRAGHRGEKLVGPFALGFDEQLELAADLPGTQRRRPAAGTGQQMSPGERRSRGGRRGSTC